MASTRASTGTITSSDSPTAASRAEPVGATPTFAGYMVRRLTHRPAESLKFAAALVSIKVETPGPFRGRLNDVLERMKLH